MKLLPPALIALTLLSDSSAACFDSPREVWAEHPRSHPTWRYINHRQCWRAALPSARHVGRGRHGGFRTAAVPVLHLRDWLTAAEGRALSRYLLGE